MGFIKAASLDELKPGQMKSIQIREIEIYLANADGNIYAIGNRCTHANCLLSGGLLEGLNMRCPCHFSIFNVQTGAVVKAPATKSEPTYQVKIENDQILVDI